MDESLFGLPALLPFLSMSTTSATNLEHETQAALSELWHTRALEEVQHEPSLIEVPRFFVSRSKEPAPQAVMQLELAKLARSKLRNHMSSLILTPEELEQLWRLLKQHSSLPYAHSIERINYDDFAQVADAMPSRSACCFFSASHFLNFELDSHGRISILHFFQWVRRKNALMQTRAELSRFDSSGCGSLSERELELWVEQIIPTLPVLAELRSEFFPFYKVTAVRKFLFFLDPKHRGRVPLKAMLASPVLHELLEMRRTDIMQEELRHNWFSLPYAEMLYADYLDLDADQNGMLSASELSRYRGSGLTTVFVQRIFQECQTYRNRETGASEIDYKSYLDFVLATTYKGTPEALGYFLRLLDLHKAGGLSSFEATHPPLGRAHTHRARALPTHPSARPPSQTPIPPTTNIDDANPHVRLLWWHRCPTSFAL